MITQSWERAAPAGAMAARFRQAASSWRAMAGNTAKLFLRKLPEHIENKADIHAAELRRKWRYTCFSAAGRDRGAVRREDYIP